MLVGYLALFTRDISSNCHLQFRLAVELSSLIHCPLLNNSTGVLGVSPWDNSVSPKLTARQLVE